MDGQNVSIAFVMLATMCIALGASLTRQWAAWVAACLRRGRGCCGVCGYRLIGLPDPRCPECGETFHAALERKR